MASYVVGGTADTWGRAWTSSELSNFRVTNAANSTARDFSLDVRNLAGAHADTDPDAHAGNLTAIQVLPTIPAGGTQSVSWLIRADREASANLTMTLRNSGGATVDTASKALTITD